MKWSTNRMEPGRGWFRFTRWLMLIAAMLVILPVAPASVASFPIQSDLMAIATNQPNAMLHLIIQKRTTGTQLEQQVLRLGGRITKDLGIINAFAADVPASELAHLTHNSAVRWISLDAPVVKTGCVGTAPCVDAGKLKDHYNKAVHAPPVWGMKNPQYLQGQGIGIAVVDTGIAADHPDLQDATGTSRVVAAVSFNSTATSPADLYGHGTHVAGIIAGNGASSGGAYVGIAPKANLINVKVSDDQGVATSSDVVAGLQWVLNNKDAYNIRVVNLSLNSSVMQSYNVDPIDAAVEILWFNKIVVVTAAGNDGKNALYPPANDPFVITVGSVDDRGSDSQGDDLLTSFSGWGTTPDGVSKPDLVAPGLDIISLLASPNAALPKAHPDHLVSGSPAYFRMSGTSMAAPMVSGAVALLLQDEPNLNPDQVKYRLKSTAHNVKSTAGIGAGELTIDAAIKSSSLQTANTGQAASQMLWSGSTPVTWTSVNWTSVNWTSVNWTSVNWTSVNWTDINWTGSEYWGP